MKKKKKAIAKRLEQIIENNEWLYHELCKTTPYTIGESQAIGVLIETTQLIKKYLYVWLEWCNWNRRK